MYVYIYIYIYIYLFFIYLHLYIYISIYVYICIHVYIYVYIYIQLYMCIHLYVQLLSPHQGVLETDTVDNPIRSPLRMTITISNRRVLAIRQMRVGVVCAICTQHYTTIVCIYICRQIYIYI